MAALNCDQSRATQAEAIAMLTQREVAHYLRLSERTLERLRVTGDGPAFVKLLRRVLYRQADLDEWIASRVVRSTSEAGCLKS
jgi:predicted DNA-binding transcriptional regulator AlpA